MIVSRTAKLIDKTHTIVVKAISSACSVASAPSKSTEALIILHSLHVSSLLVGQGPAYGDRESTAS